ncbi:hypothetical protein ES703_28288 [subsurface metagenome]
MQYPPTRPQQPYGGRQPYGRGSGPGGSCTCPQCRAQVQHQTGTPCYEMYCPVCLRNGIQVLMQRL